MTVKDWQVLKMMYCSHAEKDVRLEAELVYPAEWMPYQQPRVLAHRCSNGIECNLEGRPSCVWAGTNPAFDPFIEAT
jgi:hypothetical protein